MKRGTGRGGARTGHPVVFAQRWGSRLRAGGAPFRFFPEEGTAFFEPAGWREAEFRSVFEEAHRLKRTMRLAWLWRFLGRFGSERKRQEFVRMSGIVLLGRSDRQAAGTGGVRA